MILSLQIRDINSDNQINLVGNEKNQPMGFVYTEYL